MPQQQSFVPSLDDAGQHIRATVTGKLVSVASGFVDLETHGGDDARHVVRMSNPTQATWERVAPAEWPPQPGDLWVDQSGAAWFVYQQNPQMDQTLSCRTATGGYADHGVERHLLERSPLKLLVRHGKLVTE
jgi:hypothetical protein